MNHGYRLTPQADQDLVDIWQFSREIWGVTQANAYLNDLVTQPDLGKGCNHIRKNYRVYHTKRHLVFYRSNNHQIEIVRILHDRMNIINHI